jgi:hypothetical protein
VVVVVLNLVIAYVVDRYHEQYRLDCLLKQLLGTVAGDPRIIEDVQAHFEEFAVDFEPPTSECSLFDLLDKNKDGRLSRDEFNRFQRCEKRRFYGHLYVKAIFLPRQARDKHGENSKKEWCFSQGQDGNACDTEA